MTKSSLQELFGNLRILLTMTRRLVEQFPEDKMNFRPVPEVRDVSEIVVHIYQMLEESVATVKAGKVIEVTPPVLTSKSELLAWMDQQAAKFWTGFENINDAQLGAQLYAFGEHFFGWQFLVFTYNEVYHHRGQLTVYLRLCGIEPVGFYSET
jgi:uncharacterized damage-inducible protein DinB